MTDPASKQKVNHSSKAKIDNHRKNREKRSPPGQLDRGFVKKAVPFNGNGTSTNGDHKQQPNFSKKAHKRRKGDGPTSSTKKHKANGPALPSKPNQTRQDHQKHDLPTILKTQTTINPSELIPLLLVPNRGVCEQTILKLTSTSAAKLLLSIFELLPNHAKDYATLEWWIRGLLEKHDQAFAKDELLMAKVKPFVESSESRNGIYNALCKLASRVDLILNHQTLMMSSRNAQLAPSQTVADEKPYVDESPDETSEEGSTDDEPMAFASTNPNWQDSDFLGEPSTEASAYESEEPQPDGVDQAGTSESE